MKREKPACMAELGAVETGKDWKRMWAALQQHHEWMVLAQSTGKVSWCKHTCACLPHCMQLCNMGRTEIATV